MGRVEALGQINQDKELKEEILTRISEDSSIARRLVESAPGAAEAVSFGVFEALDAEPASATTARAMAIIEAPPEVPTDPGLEAIILLMGRPVLLVKDDDFDTGTVETDTWKSRLERARVNLKRAILSVGRIELSNHPQLDWVGTGWVVADDVIVTNRHVAEIFARREGGARRDAFVFRTSFQGQMGARVDFREELTSVTPAEFRLLEVLHIEEDRGPDIAFLRVDWVGGTGARRVPIPLARAIAPGRAVSVIGYPAKDSRTRIPEEMDRIFGNVYNVKRLAPGDLTALVQQDQLITHDCTTLGGNSGSVVVDLETGEAAALHFSGRERERNFAVAAATVRARLEQVMGTRPAAAPVVRPAVPAPALEATPTLQDMAGRDGYNRDFLGVRVDHPALSPELEDALAPVLGNSDGILDYTHYSARMHRFRRLAMYTAVNIDGAKARNIPRGRDRWSLDPRVDPKFQAGEKLYEDNKLDRGHLVRRLDPAWGDSFKAASAAALDTFFFTNCAPQHEILNQQLWLSLEDHILGTADVLDLKVSVFNGPVFRDSDRKYREILIPEDFWKVVALVDTQTGRLSVTGYMVSQRDFMDDIEFAFGPFKTYQVPVATIEQQTGLDFGALKDFDPLGHTESFAFRALDTLDDIAL